jgi:hypothetical protein
MGIVLLTLGKLASLGHHVAWHVKVLYFFPAYQIPETEKKNVAPIDQGLNSQTTCCLGPLL